MKPPTSIIRVAVIEDNLMFREGSKYMLDFSPDFELTGDYGNGDAGLSGIKANVPDVVLMDIDIPGSDGLACTRELKSNPQTAAVAIIIFTVLDDDYQILEAILAGASGYLLKSEAPQRITEAISQVYQGESPMSPAIARKVMQLVKISHAVPKGEIVLNKREREVLEGLVDGLTYKMISEKHFIAIDTVRSYIRSIYEKLQVHSRSEAVVKAIRLRLV